MLPFHQLLKSGTPFHWDDTLNQLFKESKAVIASEIKKGVCIFDKSKPTCLATDRSKSGVGFWLFQKHCQCVSKKPFCCPTGWKIALVGNQFTHPTESRYAPVEGEAHAVADALDKAQFFVLGCNDLIIAVDHTPLLKIFSDQSLEEISNSRICNLKEKTLRYRFQMIHIPGVHHRPLMLSHITPLAPQTQTCYDSLMTYQPLKTQPASSHSTPLCIQSWLGYAVKNHHWKHAPMTSTTS